MKKFTFLLMFLFHLPLLAIKLTPIHEEKVMGTEIKVYQIPSNSYLYNKFSEKNGHEILELGENMIITQKDGKYYFIGETEKNLTGFVVSGGNRVIVLGVGRIAQGKLLKQAEKL